MDAHLKLPELERGQANIAYGLCPSFRGRGLASRAVALMCTYGGEGELDWYVRNLAP